jgi:hypothetical protein
MSLWEKVEGQKFIFSYPIWRIVKHLTIEVKLRKNISKKKNNESFLIFRFGFSK